MKLLLRLRLTSTTLFLLAFLSSIQSLSDSSTSFTMKSLEGKWEGFLIGGESFGKTTLSIENGTLHYHRDEGHWFKTNITLPDATSPQQLHATIQECPTEDIIGEVVYSILKIENGTLVFAGKGDSVKELPTVFKGPGIMRHEFQKTQSLHSKLDAGRKTESN